MCNRIDHNSGVSSNPSAPKDAGPKNAGDLGTARKRCFEVPKQMEVPKATNGNNTDAQALQVQSQLTGILSGLMR